MNNPRALVPHAHCLALAALIALAAPAPVHAAAVAATNAVEPAADRLSYVLLGPESGDSTMSGSMEDLRRARSLRAGGEGLLYVRQGTAAYVIRDAATLRQAELIFEPQQALGKQQAALGSRQAALGQRQAQLGAEQARLGAQMADVSARRAGELGRQQGELGRKQNALGQQQHVLGQQQAALGREQARLGRQAEARIRALVAEAIRRGTAQRVD